MKRRPWTAEDQQVAEELLLLGCGYREIGRELGRSHSLVRCRLDPAAAERHRDATARCHKARPEKARARNRRWRRANMQRERLRKRIYHRANPSQERERHRRREALERAARRQALFPVTREAIAARFRLFGDRCAYCGSEAPLTVDHVLALSAGGVDEASNVVPACKACNSGKRDSPAEAWFRRQSFFTEARWRAICRASPHAIAGQLPLALLRIPSPPPRR